MSGAGFRCMPASALALGTLLVLVALCRVSIAVADSTQAACAVYPRGEDREATAMPCVFSQQQGHVTIRRDDGVEYDLLPVEGESGAFRDKAGGMVYRESGLEEQGLIFRFASESVYVYWHTAMLEPADESNPTWPFTTDDYDATTLLRCKESAAADFESCPAGILRTEDGEASVVVQSPSGERFTINFLTDYINATNREVEARRDGDTWIVMFADGAVWEVPQAAIDGG